MYPPGNKVKDYTCIKELGSGNYATVFLVQNHLQEKFAAKVFKSKDHQNALFEATLLLQVEHPNIVKFKQFFEFAQKSLLAIIMEYCSEQTLLNFIGKLDERKQKKWMIQLAQAVAYLHGQMNIIHRDLKPDNIFISGENLKVGDFGVSKMLGQNIECTGTCKGTHWYMDKRVTQTDAKYGKQVDIWSLGIIFIQIVSGRRIYDLIPRGTIPANLIDFPNQQVKDAIASSKYLELIKGMLDTNIVRRYTIFKILQVLGVQTDFKLGKNFGNYGIKQNYNNYSQEFYNSNPENYFQQRNLSKENKKKRQIDQKKIEELKKIQQKQQEQKKKQQEQKRISQEQKSRQEQKIRQEQKKRQQTQLLRKRLSQKEDESCSSSSEDFEVVKNVFKGIVQVIKFFK